MTAEILSPDHPLWAEFIARLQGKEGCHFRLHPSRGYVWRCDHDLRRTRAILANMGAGIDVEATLAYFRGRGLGCDCQVLFNAAGDDLDLELH